MDVLGEVFRACVDRIDESRMEICDAIVFTLSTDFSPSASGVFLKISCTFLLIWRFHAFASPY